MKEYLKEDAPVQNELLMIEVRLRQADFSQIRGTVADDELQRQYLRIQSDVLLLIDLLSEFDLDLKKSKSQSGPKQGHVLYQIPDYMGVEKEEICKVRIALEEVKVREGIASDEEVIIQQIRIADVMQVNLLDPQESPAFSIRTFSELVQFIDEDTFTEWTFYVKPLTEGQHILLLKVAVIELINGRERKREIVLEERITVTADSIKLKGEPAFKLSKERITVLETGSYPPIDREKTSLEGLDAAREGGSVSHLDQMLEEVPLSDSKVSGRFPIPQEGVDPHPRPQPEIVRRPAPLPAPAAKKSRSWVWPMVATFLVIMVGTWTLMIGPNKKIPNPPEPPTATDPVDSTAVDSVRVDSAKVDSTSFSRIDL